MALKYGQAALEDVPSRRAIGVIVVLFFGDLRPQWRCAKTIRSKENLVRKHVKKVREANHRDILKRRGKQRPLAT
jgi:hypothetical protein